MIHGSGKVMLCHNGATWRPGALHSQYRFADGFMVEYSERFYQRLVRAMLGASMARPAKNWRRCIWEATTCQRMGSRLTANLGQRIS